MKKYLLIMAGIGGTIVTADFMLGMFTKVRAKYRKWKKSKQKQEDAYICTTIGFKTKAELEAIASKTKPVMKEG